MPTVASGVIVYQGPPSLSRGWFDIELELLGGTALTEPVLTATFEGGENDAVEYALGPARPGLNRYLVKLDGRLERLRLFDETRALEPDTVGATRISRVTRLTLLRRALAIAPDEVGRAAYWRLLGKKVRARNILKRLLPVPAPIAYREWVRARTTEWVQEIAQLSLMLSDGAARKGVAVAVLLSADEKPSPATMRSIEGQDGGAPEVRLVADSGGRAVGLNKVLEQAKAPWLLVVRNGDVLEAGTLLRVLAAAHDHPEAAVIYGDHDHIDERGRRRAPHFKPDWNASLFWIRDYIGLAAFRCTRAREAGGFRVRHPGLESDDLTLRLASDNPGFETVVHIPRLLHHVGDRIRSGAGSEASARVRLVRDHLSQSAPGVRVDIDDRGQPRIAWPLPEPVPVVSLIVPTRDRVDLLEPCIEGLRSHTDYPNLEIIVADNGSSDHATLDYLRRLAADPRVRILPMPGPFNFAAINNRAVREARGSVIGFINNDIEVMTPGWLREMVGWALRPGVGAVGAKLLYPMGYVQHAGVIIGIKGIAGHAHRFFPADHAGYMGRLQAVQHVSAVTAACLVVERKKFEAAGGFDAEAFPVALNDVDLCLRLGRLGHRSLYTPHATLLHKESATRAHDQSRGRRAAYAREVQAFRERWPQEIERDPCYSPLLTRDDESFSLG